MAVVIAIRKRTIGPNRLIESQGSIAPVGSIATVVGNVVPPGVVVLPTLVGGVTFTGELATETSGPSIVTLIKDISGSISPSGSLASSNLGGGEIDPVTKDVSGIVSPTGECTPVIDPATVKVLKTVVGSVGPLGALHTDIFDIIVSRALTASITPQGIVATLAGGPSFVTIPQSKSGSVTPSGALATAITTPGLDFSQGVDGTITPAGDLAAVIDPFTVVVLQSKGGTITPAGAMTFFSNKTVTKAVGGTITPAGARSGLVSGPSFVTLLKSVGGSITPHGAIGNVTVPPPVTFFAKALAAVITPTGNLTKVVSGPSIVTIPKLLASGIAPVGVVARSVSGPSFVTVPKAVSGGIVPHGNATHVKGGQSNVVITQSKGGTVTPIGSVSRVVNPGSVIGTNPMYTSMYQWEVGEFDLSPQWNSIITTAVHQGESVAFWANYFAQMRSRGMKGGPAFMSPADIGVKRADGTLDFSFTKYKALVDIIAAVPNIASYILGGECGLCCAGDEAQHAKWNGTWTVALRKQCCQYIKQKLPGTKTWFRMPAGWLGGRTGTLPVGGWEGSLDYGCSQWTGPNRGDSGETKQTTPLRYFQVGRDGLAALGLGIVCAVNWVNGGDGSSGVIGADGTDAQGNNYWMMTTQEIKASIDAAVQITESDWCTFWYDARNSALGGASRMLPFQLSTAYDNMFKYVKATGVARGATTPSPTYYTATTPSAAPYPPPAIPVGGAVRDSMSDHKVFHLLDDAIVGTAEYPALNNDNSMVYFQRGGAGMLGNVTWNVAQSTVQVGTIRGAFGAGPFGELDTVTWDRANSRYMYFTGVNAPPVLYRRDAVAGTTVTLKAFDVDPSFNAVWSNVGQTPSALKLVGLHSSRFQERFVATVRSASAAVGVVAWSRLTGEVWNWQVLSGKTIVRTTIDDVGQYLKVHFSDDTWIILTLGTQAQVTQSAILSSTDAPNRDDSQANKLLQSSGVGVKSWTYSPASAAAATVYAHPLKSGKTDLFAKGKVSLQAVDEVAYESLFYSGLLSAPWVLHSGEIYKLSWSSELVSQPQKGATPEVVRQGVIQLTRKADITGGGSSGPTTGFFVSPGGSSNANGSITNPWPLSFVLSGGAPIPAGSTVWVRGGVYGSNTEYVSFLEGAPTARTVVRAYPGERPVINGNLAVFGADVTYWGLEVYRSVPNDDRLGVMSKGPRTKFVNMIIHDACASGMGIWVEAVDAEVYGCLVYHNGTHTNLDHGIYTQNQTGRRVIRDCIIFDNLTYGLHGYSSTTGYLTNITYDGNISFKNGVRSPTGKAPDYLLGGVPVSGAIVSNNASYRPNDGETTARFGYFGINSTTLSWTDNYFVGAVDVLNFSAATQSGNTLISSSSPPTTGIKVIVRPNQYEPGRANVGVWNWGNAPSTSISIAGLGAYEIRNAENFFAAPVATGVGPTVSIPLNGAKFQAFVVAPVGTLPGSTGGGGGTVTLNRSEWAYDPTNQVIYVRCSDGLSPATKRMVVFDWRFGTEEIVMVYTTGILKGRLCHHHSFVSDPTIEVDAFRGGSVSYDGSRVVFTTNWGGQPTLGVYCALTDPRL